MRAVTGLVALVLAWQAFAEERVELGVRYWLSRGENTFAHNAQPANPALGNPTSILTYEDLDAHALEVHGRSNFGERWFIKGNFGLGHVADGSFDDEDYFAGQVKFSDTTSSVEGDRFSWLTLDLGRELWASAGGGARLGVFAGVQQWSETVDANGAIFTTGTGFIPFDVRVISNEVRWRSLRLGAEGKARLGARTRVIADLAFVPYADLRNEDSHYLRADLGPVPNIITTGRGAGVQVDLELRHGFGKRMELGIGIRHWRLQGSDAEATFAGVTTLPVNEFETRRTGLTASITGRW